MVRYLSSFFSLKTILLNKLNYKKKKVKCIKKEKIERKYT